MFHRPPDSPAPTLRSSLEQATADAVTLINAIPDDYHLTVAWSGELSVLGIDEFVSLQFSRAHSEADDTHPAALPDLPTLPDWSLTCSQHGSPIGDHRISVTLVKPVYLQSVVKQALARFRQGESHHPEVDGFDPLEGRIFLHHVFPQADAYTLPSLNAAFSTFSCAQQEAQVPLYRGSLSYVPVPLDEPLWKVRERCRARKTYDPLPRALLDVLPPEVLGSQFPHLAVKEGNAGLIAYTANEHAGIVDRQQTIKPGRYIRQHCPHLSDEQVKQLAAEVVGALDADIHVSHDPEEFERVYRKGPSSCMAYGPDGKDWHVLMVDGAFYHPTRVYAHPENHIRIVWVEQGGRIGARTLINTHTKQYPVIYHSDSVANARRKLEMWLDAHGYTQNDNALRGEKLIRQAVDCDPDSIICPYIDCGNQGVEVYHDHLIVGGPHEADHETGCLEDFKPDLDTSYCDDCGERTPDDDLTTTTNDDQVCPACLHNHYQQVYDLSAGQCSYALDGSSNIYELHSSANRAAFDYESLVYGTYHDLRCANLVELSGCYYDATDLVAEEDDCIRDENGDWLLLEDVTEFGLFCDEDDDIARSIERWAVLIEDDGGWSLVLRKDLDDAQHTQVPLYPTDCPYPMLPCYAAVSEDETEEVV